MVETNAFWVRIDSNLQESLFEENSLSIVMETLQDFITTKMKNLATSLVEEMKSSVTALTLEDSQLRQKLSIANTKCFIIVW